MDNAFPATVAAAMQILNDFKPVITETTKQVSLGTAFPQDGAFKKQSKGRLSDEAWNALSPEAKFALVKNGIVTFGRNIFIPFIDIHLIWTIHSCDIIDNVQVIRCVVLMSLHVALD